MRIEVKGIDRIIKVLSMSKDGGGVKRTERFFKKLGTGGKQIIEVVVQKIHLVGKG